MTTVVLYRAIGQLHVYFGSTRVASYWHVVGVERLHENMYLVKGKNSREFEMIGDTADIKVDIKEKWGYEL